MPDDAVLESLRFLSQCDPAAISRAAVGLSPEAAQAIAASLLQHPAEALNPAGSPEDDGLQPSPPPPPPPPAPADLSDIENDPAKEKDSPTECVPQPHPPDTARSDSNRHTICSASTTLTRTERARLTASTQRETVIPNNSFDGESGFHPGILEAERRRASIKQVFNRWECSQGGDTEGGEGAHEEGEVGAVDPGVSLAELEAVLACFYSCRDETLESVKQTSEVDLPELDIISWPAFEQYITALSRDSSPRDFDGLCDFLIQCNGDVSKVQERQRRGYLVKKLFTVWCGTPTGTIQMEDVARTLEVWVARTPPASEDLVRLLLSRAQTSGTHSVSKGEFASLMLNMLFPASSGQFDTLVYTLLRAHEVRRACPVHSEHSAALCDTLLEVVYGSASDPFAPVIVHGGRVDPCAGVEAAAAEGGAVLNTFLLTHDQSVADAIKVLMKNGFQRGEWVHIVLDQTYPSEPTLRQVGILLSTNADRGAGMIHKKFRIFISTVQSSVLDFPKVLLLKAVLINVDTLKRQKKKAIADLPPDRKSAAERIKQREQNARAC